MLKSVLCSFLLASCIRTAYSAKKSKKAAATKSSSNNDANDRIRLINAKISSADVMYLTDSNHSKFISSVSREYTTIAMYTALSKNHQCGVCTSLLPIFADVASYYNEQYDFNSSIPRNRLAFFIIDADTAGRTFEIMGIETVPKFYIYPPKEINQKLKKDFLEVNNR